MARGANSGTAATCAIGVMAKAPQSGRSKTRLCPPLTPDQAATLSAAFLRDTTGNIRRSGALRADRRLRGLSRRRAPRR